MPFYANLNLRIDCKVLGNIGKKCLARAGTAHMKGPRCWSGGFRDGVKIDGSDLFFPPNVFLFEDPAASLKAVVCSVSSLIKKD